MDASHLFKLSLTILAVLAISGCDSRQDKSTHLLPEVPLASRTTPTANGAQNEEAPIPPQCYTKTEGKHNPCYVCHQEYDSKQGYRINRRNDGANQGEYTFSDLGETNQWHNLFVDRSDWVDAIDDEQIQAYVNQDNYSPLPQRLKQQGWQGYIPDLENFHLAAAAFDERGLAKDGSHWVAFNYKPFPGTFWPTNGATDDVLIRLAEPFRSLNGQLNNSIYWLNLSLVEMTIKDLAQIQVFPVNEKELGLDIDQNGRLENQVTLLKRSSHYLGDASHIQIAPQQYPAGTEMLHSVRYIGVADDNTIYAPPRLKELRYMQKTKVMSEAELDNQYRRERKEKLDEQLPMYTRIQEKGFNNKFGWLVQGFIEDYDGELRPQTYEEELFCMGCHSAIGTTIDHTFAFPRKVTGAKGWGYIDLNGMKDAPAKGELIGDIAQYLIANGGGNEFRENDEMQHKWYQADGGLDTEKLKQADVYQLITPSAERALALNKAYTHIVRHQSYIYGRDAYIKPAKNVYKQIDEAVTPIEKAHRIDDWDIRLIDWE